MGEVGRNLPRGRAESLPSDGRAECGSGLLPPAARALARGDTRARAPRRRGVGAAGRSPPRRSTDSRTLRRGDVRGGGRQGARRAARSLDRRQRLLSVSRGAGLAWSGARRMIVQSRGNVPERAVPRRRSHGMRSRGIPLRDVRARTSEPSRHRNAVAQADCVRPPCSARGRFVRPLAWLRAPSRPSWPRWPRRHARPPRPRGSGAPAPPRRAGAPNTTAPADPRRGAGLEPLRRSR